MTHPLVSLDTTLAEHAEVCCGRGGHAVLVLRLRLPPGDRGRTTVALARRDYGPGNAAWYAAKARAHELRRGVRVRVASAHLHMERGLVDLGPLAELETPDLAARPGPLPLETP